MGLLNDSEFQFDYGTVIKTNNVSFFEESDKFGLVFPGKGFDIDFMFKLSKEEVMSSFSVIFKNGEIRLSN